MKQFALLIALSLILAACSSGVQAPIPATAPASDSSSMINQPSPTATLSNDPDNLSETQTLESIDQPSAPSDDMVRVDEQGMVALEVIPLNLENPRESLEFEVDLNTHSVDLSMDLATLATLSTDTGKVVQASLWDAPRGGHHVSGKLIFPATEAGEPILEGAKELSLIVKNLDVPERVFSWELNR